MFKMYMAQSNESMSDNVILFVLWHLVSQSHFPLNFKQKMIFLSQCFVIKRYNFLV